MLRLTERATQCSICLNMRLLSSHRPAVQTFIWSTIKSSACCREEFSVSESTLSTTLSRVLLRSGTGRSAHHGLNDLIWRALSAANIPAAKEPSGLLRSDGKIPDGLTLIPWQNGRSVTWDVTVTDTVAQSYLPVNKASSGGAAEAAAERKTAGTDLHFRSNCS